MLEARNIKFSYPGAKESVLNGINLTLPKNQILSVIGPSGSGKSTLLHLLAGLIQPTAGSITFEGSQLKNPDEQLIAGHESIKLVFQDFKVMPNRTVEENIRYKLLHFNNDYQNERVQDLLELCKLEDCKNSLPSHLSGGQQQRLALARTLADDPKVLLMDEPFSNLDPVTKGDLFERVMDIVNTESLSLILVSHDIQDVLQMTDQIIFLSQGLMVQEGSPIEFYENPRNELVARFFGPLNDLSLILNKPNTFIRREHIKFSLSKEQGYPAKLLNSTFVLGDRYLNKVVSNCGTVIYGYTSAPLKTVNEGVCFKFNSKKLLYFRSS